MPSIEEFTPEFFDQCSDAWMKNKMRKGASMAYVCVAITKDGTQCTRSSVIKDALSEHLCKQHAKYHINKMGKDE